MLKHIKRYIFGKLHLAKIYSLASRYLVISGILKKNNSTICNNKNIVDIWPPIRPFPIIYFIEPSSICNAACIFCHYPQMRDQGKKNLIAKNETIEKAISFLKNDVDQRGLKKLGISLTPTTGDILINKMWGIYATNILQLHFVDWLDIVTNGILLDEDNVRIICNLPNMQKLNFSISVGGVDRETYQLMFGTDMFNKVRKNINHFMKELKDKNIKLNVAINLRVPDSKKISQEIINSTFNEVGYKWAHYSVLDEYKDVPENVDGKKILKMSNKISERSNIPCGMLDSGALNFTAEGRITACGCHYSQKLGDDSLVLGSVDAVLGEVNAKRLSLISDWRELNKIPQLCSTCQHYHVHDGLESNGLMLQRQIKNEPY